MPAPEDLPAVRVGTPIDRDDPAFLITTALRPTGFEARWIDPHPGGPPRPGVQRLWVRSQEPLGDDPMLHRAALAYISDYPALEVALLPFGLGWSNGNLSVVSLDHAMWFHRDFDLADWLLCETELVTTGGGRALVRGSFYDRGGALVATFHTGRRGSVDPEGRRCLSVIKAMPRLRLTQTVPLPMGRIE